MMEGRRMLALLRKEFTQLWRDRRLLIMGLFAPVILLIIFAYALPTGAGKIPTVIVNEDSGELWKEIYRSLLFSPQFRVVKVVDSRSEALSEFYKGSVKAIFHILPDYSQKLQARERGRLDVFIDGSDPTIAGPALAAAQAILTGRSHGHIVSLVREKRLLEGTGWYQLAMPLDANVHVWFNRGLRFINFTVPGVIGLILQQMTLALTALAFVGERENGTLEQLLATPLRRYEIVLGKLVPYGTLTLLSVLAVLAIGRYWFDVPLRGSVALLLILSVVFVLASMAMGFCLSVFSRSQMQALVVTQLVLVPTFILSGFIFPREVMPKLIYYLSALIPLTHYLTIVRGIFLKGIGLSALWDEALLLIAFATVLFGTAVLLFRRQATN